jgi:4-cresol dehydrogenase (hydroxylating)
MSAAAAASAAWEQVSPPAASPSSSPTSIDVENVTGRARLVAATYRPENVAQIVALVRAARAARAPLYPVSCGLNWGYGSRSPAVDHCSIVDLSAMKGILNADAISVSNPVAVIEPGVTQRQMYAFLRARCPDLTFNVTGAAQDTSILGNALDRGVGYFGPRREDVFGLEVVCGTGKMLRTGFRRLGEDSPLAHSHPYGLGPMVDGLFFQSNFGIVTSACLRLVPRRPKEVVVSFALRDETCLAAFVDALARLKREGLMASVTHIGNRARTHATLMFGITRYLENECGLGAGPAREEAEEALRIVAPTEWTSLGAVTGNAAQVRAAVAEIRGRMSGLARVMVVTERRVAAGYAVAHRLRFLRRARRMAAVIDAVRPLHALALGVPTDVAVDNLLWRFGRADLPAARLDESNCGLLFVNPALPMDGALVARVMRDMKSVAASHGHEPHVTLNIETATSLVAVINLLFDRSQSAEVERAHRCAKALLARIRSYGLEVYRARADMMEDIVAADPGYWKTIRALKRELDPDNIISPGRYNLP